MVDKLVSEFTGTGEVQGFKFNRIAESDTDYAYRVDTGSSIHYEVFKKKTTPICIDFESRKYSETDSKEIYPKAKDFGVWAYTCRNMEEVMDKISGIVELNSL